jgi:carbonic anhydrase
MSQIHGWIGRRDFLKQFGIGGASLAAAATGSLVVYPQPVRADESVPPSQASVEELTPEQALQKLLQGNRRFVRQKRAYPHQSQSRLQEVATAQHPFATLLTCADSRVPAEIIFDQGIGDLFDVRMAGNIVTPEAIGSLEYGAAILGTPILMVLGHERCGAVTAAVQGEALPGQISTFVKAIAPALAKVKDKSGDAVENAVVANVQYQVEKLKQSSPLLAQRLEAGQLKIVGGRYDLDTGEITIIS